jgi:MinD superfamily P-loop ATPase
VQQTVVISGKGGTGKTSIAASLAVLAERCVVADADVDAADLHLVLSPTLVRREAFSGGFRATIRLRECDACGICGQLCRFDAVVSGGQGNRRTRGTYHVDPMACEGCGVCAHFCPQHAIDMTPALSGELFISDTRCGPMVHARLGVAQANSGKLVSLVRARAAAIADERRLEHVLIDGSPGVGCPVIASVTGADEALIVTEPTLSGLRDLERVADLTLLFDVRTRVCVNKWDLNEELTRRIEEEARRRGISVAGKVRYDPAVTRAQVETKAVVECACGAADDIRLLWENLRRCDKCHV